MLFANIIINHSKTPNHAFSLVYIQKSLPSSTLRFSSLVSNIPILMSSEPNNHRTSTTEDQVRHRPPVQVKPPPSSSLSFSSLSFSTPPSTSSSIPHLSTLIASAQRRIAIAVDLSDESAFSVKWAVENYLRPGDAVILLHISPTSILYGADLGSTTPTSTNAPPPSPSPHHHDQKLEEDFDNLTNTKTTKLAQPLVEARIPFKIHIVKDHDLKERLCLEVERPGPRVWGIKAEYPREAW